MATKNELAKKDAALARRAGSNNPAVNRPTSNTPPKTSARPQVGATNQRVQALAQAERDMKAYQQRQAMEAAQRRNRELTPGNLITEVPAGEAAGRIAKGAASGVGTVGKEAFDLLGPDREAWGNIFSGDATLADWGSAALDASILIPGAGLGIRTAGKAALKYGGRAATKKAGEAGAKQGAGAIRRGLLGEVRDAAGNPVAYGKAAKPGAKQTHRGYKIVDGKRTGGEFFNPRKEGRILDALEGGAQKLAPGQSRTLDTVLGRRGGLVNLPFSQSARGLGTKAALGATRNIASGQALNGLFGPKKAGGKAGGDDEIQWDIPEGPPPVIYLGGGGGWATTSGGQSVNANEAIGILEDWGFSNAAQYVNTVGRG